MKTIRIDGIVGDFLNTVEEFKYRVDMLALDPDEPLAVVINSQGGSVFEGFGIYNYLVSLPNEIHTEIEGLAASISTLIAASAKKENSSISEIAMYMIHKAATGTQGNSEDHEKQVDVLKSIDETLITVYTSRTGKTRNQIEKLMSDETWYTGTNAVKEGFVGNLINRVDAKTAAIAQQIQIQNNMNYFKSLLNKYSNNGATTEPVTEPVAQVEPVAVEADPVVEPVVEPVAQTTVEADPVVEPVTEPVAIVDPEEEDQPIMEVVSMERFNKLEQMVIELVENFSKAKPVAEQVQEAFTAQVKGLPGSNGNPRQQVPPVTKTATYHSPVEKYRAAMKEIEDKTRIK